MTMTKGGMLMLKGRVICNVDAGGVKFRSRTRHPDASENEYIDQRTQDTEKEDRCIVG